MHDRPESTLRIAYRNPTKLSEKPPASPFSSDSSPPGSRSNLRGAPSKMPLMPSLLDQLQLLAAVDPVAFEAVRLYIESELARAGHEVRASSHRDTPTQSQPRWGWQSHILFAATLLAGAV